VDSPALPKPIQRPRPPIIIGGRGPTRTPRLAATYADEFNAQFTPVPGLADDYERIDRACETIGRDPTTLLRSVAAPACVGRDEAEFARRAEALGRTPDEMRKAGVTGLPDEAAEKLAAYRDAGAARIYLQVIDIRDLDHLDVIAAALTG
jgi:alkanesulfonate monooxygenase SsuD/methylene tetrahydromethanopterin reductase-like flavin-dependent oxidoreductase (luciferase family)